MKTRSKQELVNEIFWQLHQGNTAKTRKEICQMLGYSTKSPAPHIIKVIEGLVDEQMLIKLPYEIPNGLQGFKYFTNQIEAEKLTNEIPENSSET